MAECDHCIHYYECPDPVDIDKSCPTFEKNPYCDCTECRQGVNE